jgi:hypothetical protein
MWGRDSSVGIETRDELDGPGIESRWRRDFPHMSRPVLGPSQLPINGYRVFPGGKVAGAWCWPPTPSSTEVKERVELYLYCPSGPSWPVLRRSLYLSKVMIFSFIGDVSGWCHVFNLLYAASGDWMGAVLLVQVLGIALVPAVTCTAVHFLTMSCCALTQQHTTWNTDRIQAIRYC